jgi:hypothetical protein
MPANIQHNVQRSFSGPNFSGEIVWHTAAGELLTANVFDLGVRYVATITLRPHLGYIFNPSPHILTDTYLNVWHSRINLSNDVFTPDIITITLDFNETEISQALEFTLRQSYGPFDSVTVYTHYLGSLSPQNFLVHFGDLLNPSNQVDVTQVSTYNFAGGYYIITLAQNIQPDNITRLYVEMQGQLSYHEVYPMPAYIIPKTN